LDSELGHWESNVPVNPSTAFGFLYCIENTATGQFYWGKKQFFHGGKRKSKTKGKEMPWRTYTGSSGHLKDDIEIHGYDKFKFVIVETYKTKGGLYYAEAYCQMLSDCMTKMLPDGSKPRFYNRQIAAIRFIPREEPTEITKKFITKIKRRCR